MESEFVDAYKLTDTELGELLFNLVRQSAVNGWSNEYIGKQVREWFNHACQGQVDRENTNKLRLFAIYMKDAFGTPEGASATEHAINVLHNYKLRERGVNHV